LRSERARQRHEDTVVRWILPEQWLAPAADRPASKSDDALILLFMGSRNASWVGAVGV
jgi:hypothetical protein